MKMINIEASGSSIIFWGRDSEGNLYKKRDDTFKPYFYVPDSQGKYLSCFGERLRKVTVKVPGDVPKERLLYDKHYEADILYKIRYILDKTDGTLEKEPIRVCYLDIETESGSSAKQKFPDVDNPENKIISVCCYDNFEKRYRMFVLSEQFDKSFSLGEQVDIEYFVDEVDMIKSLCKYIRKRDFDLFSGYYIDKFDIIYIVNRMKKLNIDMKLICRDTVKAFVDDYKRVHIWGRDTFDIYFGIKELKSGERKSWKLNDVGLEELGYGKVDYDGDLGDLWYSDRKKFLEYNFTDVKLLVDLDKKYSMIEYFDEVCRLSKCGWENVFTTNIVNDCLLLQFCKDRYVLPSVTKRKKEPYSGAFIDVYGSGVFKDVLILDYRSLYPTIMMLYNISLETISSKFSDIPVGNNIYFNRDKLGIVPELLYYLFKKRMEYKKMTKECVYGSSEYIRYNNIQRAYKVRLNSFYGLFGYVGSRIYNSKCADSVTFVGKKIIMKSSEVAKRLGFDVLYCHSVGKDSEVLIDENNSVSIEDIWNNCEGEVFKDGCRESKVLNKDILTVGKDYKTKKSLCTNIIRHKIDGYIYRVYLTNSSYIDVTKDHSLIVLDKLGDFKEVKVDELQKYKYVISPNYIRGRCVNSRGFSKEMYVFLGLFISDGFITRNSSGVDYYFGVRQDKKVVGEFIKKIFRKLSEEYGFNIYISGDGYGASSCSKFFVDFLKDLGIKKGSINKRVPNFMFNESEENICYFLKGLFSGDGSMSKLSSPIIRYSSISINLIKDIQRLLKCIGINSNHFFGSVNKYLGKVAKVPTRSIFLVIKERDVFRDKVGFLYDYQISKLSFLNGVVGYTVIIDEDRKKILHKSNYAKGCSFVRKNNIIRYLDKISDRSKKIFYGDISFNRVKKIEKFGYNGYVYDLSVPENEMFIANNILVHNTDSLYLRVSDKKERTLEELKEIGDKLSKEIVKEVRKILPKNKLLSDVDLELEFEKICHSAFFNSKTKGRNVKLVAYDGEFLKEPKLEVTGFQSIRSDTPTLLQDLLNKVFTMVLNFESEENVLSVITSFKEKFMSGKFDVSDISVTTGIKVNIPDDIEKGLSYHVKGSVYYNKYFSGNIKIGDKIKVCYVKTNSYNIDVISFTDKFPDKLEVDYNKMWKRYETMFIDVFDCLNWYSLKTGSHSLGSFSKSKFERSVVDKKVGGLFSFTKK